MLKPLSVNAFIFNQQALLKRGRIKFKGKHLIFYYFFLLLPSCRKIKVESLSLSRRKKRSRDGEVSSPYPIDQEKEKIPFNQSSSFQEEVIINY
ncbi:MAG: hypothetical protein F6K40_07250 [Okeania sp. SIO3I5]|uniref:hypothetical protein n=1 Tax=Okeania sp. SIO3I5 TaxID=2607805 RepID=UPI0013B6CF24|nr:hypothetical protein [Okeania sp. SIO3I5]NEQ36089.1 hypothetical protein [Okeania sp. SIO3I5]